MDDHAIQEMHDAEQRHFWFVGTRRIVLHALGRRLTGTASTRRLLDVGCGSGGTIAAGAQLGRWTGLDTSAAALAFARARHPEATWVQGSATALPFADASFDGVVCLDVIEHLADDHGAAGEIARVLAPGGVALIATPGWPSLFGPHDGALGHVRRYHRQQLRSLLRGAELDVVLLSSYNLLLAPAVVIARLARRALGGEGTDVRRTPTWLDTPLAWLLASERHLADRLPLRGGISLLAVVRRSSP